MLNCAENSQKVYKMYISLLSQMTAISFESMNEYWTASFLFFLNSYEKIPLFGLFFSFSSSILFKFNYWGVWVNKKWLQNILLSSSLISFKPILNIVLVMNISIWKALVFSISQTWRNPWELTYKLTNT